MIARAKQLWGRGRRRNNHLVPNSRTHKVPARSINLVPIPSRSISLVQRNKPVPSEPRYRHGDLAVLIPPA